MHDHCKRMFWWLAPQEASGVLLSKRRFEQGYTVRALVRVPGKGRQLPAAAQVVIGDVTRPDTLAAAVNDIDAIVFTLGSDGAGKVGAETVDYGGVRNILAALGSRKVRIALMTSIGVTNRTGSYNRRTEAHDWKRRAERLVRASGSPYTIVRPGWFDYNKSDEHKLRLSARRHAPEQATPATASSLDGRLRRFWSVV